MQSIILIGSKQYKVALGDFLKVDKLDIKQGETLVYDQIIAVADDNGVFTFGQPIVKKAQVKAKVIRHGKDKKILILKKKRRKGYRRTQGHRQMFSEIFIEALTDSQGEWKVYKKILKPVSNAETKTEVKTEIEKQEKIETKIQKT